jgi:hypothetical protein
MLFGLIVLSLGGGMGASQEDGGGDDGAHAHNQSVAKRARGDQHGQYALKVTGRYSGEGTANVSATVSLKVKVTDRSGASGMLVANNLPLREGYFKGTGMVLGTACTVEGRVDMASAQDHEETHQQATTGRITGTFVTAGGKAGRLVAVQVSKS